MLKDDKDKLENDKKDLEDLNKSLRTFQDRHTALLRKYNELNINNPDIDKIKALYEEHLNKCKNDFDECIKLRDDYNKRIIDLQKQSKEKDIQNKKDIKLKYTFLLTMMHIIIVISIEEFNKIADNMYHYFEQQDDEFNNLDYIIFMGNKYNINKNIDDKTYFKFDKKNAFKFPSYINKSDLTTKYMEYMQNIDESDKIIRENLMKCLKYKYLINNYNDTNDVILTYENEFVMYKVILENIISFIKLCNNIQDSDKYSKIFENIPVSNEYNLIKRSIDLKQLKHRISENKTIDFVNDLVFNNKSQQLGINYDYTVFSSLQLILNGFNLTRFESNEKIINTLIKQPEDNNFFIIFSIYIVKINRCFKLFYVDSNTKQKVTINTFKDLYDVYYDYGKLILTGEEDIPKEEEKSDEEEYSDYKDK
jgi:hypothetical protein